jgi:4-amino-4-deoxy-L-arabinose transferase-like glycosyltransferase
MSRDSAVVAGILVAALLVRLAALAWVAPTDPVADEVEYLYRSKALAGGHEVVGLGTRPPGSIWWYALFQRLGTPGVRSAQLANVVAGTALVLLLHLLGARLFGRRVGLVAATIAAFYPDFVLYSVSLWAESLYLALATGGLLLLFSSGAVGDLRGRTLAALAGVAMGLAALTREVGVVLVALAPAPWMLGRGAAGTASFVVAFAATIAPWTIALNRGDEGFALITRTSYLNLFLGNASSEDEGTEGMRVAKRPGIVFRRQREYAAFGESIAEREARAKELALQAIAERMPAWPIEKIAETIPALLTPNSLPAARLLGRPDGEGFAERWSYRLSTGDDHVLRTAVGWLTIGSWCVLALAGAAGWALAGGGPGVRVLGAFVLLHVLPVIVTFGCSRFRLPIVPVLMLGAALLAVRGAECWRACSGRRRGLVIAATAGMALVVGSMWETVVTPQWG